MNIFKKTLRILSYVTIGCGLIGIALCCCNSDMLEINKYNLKNKKMADNVSFKAAVISDYHHRELKFTNTTMIDAINGLDNDTDAIFFTGDLIDTHVKNLTDVNKMFDACNEKLKTSNGKIYFVTGNHEEYAPLWPKLRDSFTKYNVNYLDNKMDIIKKGETEIHLYGLMDPRFDLHTYKNGSLDYGKSKEYLDAFKSTIDKEKNINILLSHRPEFSTLYAEYGFDYVLCGHSHGGQVRIGNWTPLSLVAKGRAFPRGEFKINDSTTMIVSAGLGHANMFPIRINCNPEIITINISK